MPKEIGDILLTIRLMESGNRYDLPTISGGASGAYQFIDSTWNNYKGYPKAYYAPPWVQDERAALDVQSILDRYDGDVSMVPVIWYYPIAASDPALMDIVPKPQFGNRLTVREYQFRWLDMLEYVIGAPLGFRLALLPPELRFLSGLPPEMGIQIDDLTNIAYPVLGKSTVAVPPPCADEQECAPGAPAVIYAQKLQPVRAVVDGVVTNVESGDAVSGAVTLTLTDPVGRTFHYAGFNDDSPGTNDGLAHPALQFSSLAKVGTPVRAGQILGYVGDTDPMPTTEHQGLGSDPVWPHLRLTIRDADGVRLDADRLVANAQRSQACHVSIGPWAMPPDDDLADDESFETVEVSAIVNGGWTIHDDGTVTAYGKSTLIVAPEDCAWAPEDVFGPGAAGNRPPDGWEDPIHVPIRHWISGITGFEAGGPVVLRRG